MERKDLFNFLKERGYIYQTVNEENFKKLITGEPQTIYWGTDPTAECLHIGHCFPLIVLRYLQDAGHKIIILLGGATAMIGDPSGRRDMRKMAEQETIMQRTEHIKEIIARFLRTDGENPITFVNNHDWFKDINYVSFMREIGVHFNVNKMLATDACKTRMEEGGLTFFEMGYTLMQAYDFVYLNKHYGVTMEAGGSDQWANIVAGVDLARKLAIQNNEKYEQFEAFTVPLLTNSEGKKMGKSEKGALWVDKDKTSPYEFYQYFYNQNDNDVERLCKLLTPMPIAEIQELLKGDIRDAKHRMAFEVTKLVHGEKDALEAQNTAKQLFSGNENQADNAPTIEVEKSAINGISVIDFAVLSKICASKGEARRLIEQNGLSLNNEKVALTSVVSESDFKEGYALLKKGKKNFLKVVLK